VSYAHTIYNIFIIYINYYFYFYWKNKINGNNDKNLIRKNLFYININVKIKFYILSLTFLKPKVKNIFVLDG